MTYEEVLQRFEGVKRTSAAQAMARCPCHDDKKASLSISLGDQGRVVLKCHAGCDTKKVLDAVGLRMQDLFGESKPKAKRQISTVYKYHDENGNVLAEKVRYEPKGFSWRRPNGKGGWVYNRQGVPHTLYRAGTTCQSVYVVEGEKDADTMARLGFFAVSGEDGAGAGKWLPEYTATLKGRDIYILPDNDSIGLDYAQEIAEKLQAVASSVKLLNLTAVWEGMPEKADISDFIKKFGDDAGKQALTRLAEETPEWKAVEGRSVCSESKLPDFFEGNKFLFNVMGDYLIEKYGVCKINGAVHTYDNGIYKSGEEILHGYMLKLVPTLSDARRKEVFKYIKVSLDTPVKTVSPPHLIPFKSKVYDVKQDKFLDYSPDMVFLNRFPYDYKPDAPYSEIVGNTLGAIACDDFEVLSLILESFGNCFYMLNAFRGSVMLYGPSGSNGKSTLLNMLAQMVGRENASFLSLQDTAERFRLIEVYGKAVNIGDDIPDSYMPDSSKFKKLVTGETIIGERKGQDVISFRPYAKMFFAMNALPPVSDKTRAFFSRILLIPLNHDFSKDGDVSLKDREWSEAEMEFLVAQSVKGLKRLLENGNFTRPACVVAELARYELENNPILGFVSEYGNINNLRTADVYSDFRMWCEKNGHRNIVTKTKFSREVCGLYGMKTESKYIPELHKTDRCFVAQ